MVGSINRVTAVYFCITAKTVLPSIRLMYVLLVGSIVLVLIPNRGVLLS